jgi:polyhydroxybutyrate depolymerase
LPVIFALHGGGGRKEGFGPMTCADGDEADPSCLAKVANEKGFVLILPDGTESKLNLRTWGATEKSTDFQCVYACEQNIDDISYFKTLMDHVAKLVPVDPQRVFFTGFSNGGEMSHRVACDLSDRVAAIAAVGGANMIALTGTCAPSRPIPVLQIHGKADPCWKFDGGVGTCPGQPEGAYGSVVESTIGTVEKPGWAIRNGCMVDMPDVVALPDDVSDGTTAEKQTFAGCQADVQFVTITNGGHTWPGGDQYLDADTVGLVSKDFIASEMIVDFFAAHSLP